MYAFLSTKKVSQLPDDIELILEEEEREVAV